MPTTACDQLHDQFPAQRGATTAKSGQDRYIFDTWVSEDGTQNVALGSTRSTRVTVCRPEHVTLLPRFVAGTKKWADLGDSPRYDGYRTAAELSLLEAARQAPAAHIL